MTDYKATYEHKAGDLGCDFCHRTNATVTIVQSGRSYRCMDVDDCNKARAARYPVVKGTNPACKHCHTECFPLEKDFDTLGSAAYVCVDKLGCMHRLTPPPAPPEATPVDPIPTAWLAVHAALAALPDDEKRCRVIAAVCIALGIELDVNRGPRRA